jgi:3-hydroxyisobutyrate dehydrogenase
MTRSCIEPPACIGFIGIGNMGLPMARRLVEGGYDVMGHDVAPAAREKLAAAGGRVATDLAGLAEAPVVITMLPNSKIVRQVVEAMRPHLRKGAILIDMSSSDPLETRRLGEELAADGYVLIDAPVSGGVKRAIDGSLAIMAGGDVGTIDFVEPALRRMGTSIFRTGPLGSGHAMKSLNNYLSGIGLVAAVEAVEIGRRFGLDPSLMVDILNASTGRNNATENKMKQQVLSQSFASGFTIALMAKDIRIASELARRLGVAAPLIGEVAALWEAAAAESGIAADHTAVGRYLGSVGAERKKAS